MPPRRLASVLVLVAGCVTAGCLRPADGPDTPAGPEPTTPATEEECRAVATELEQAVRSGDPGQAVQAFALEVIAHRVVTGLPVAADQRDGLLKLLPAKADTNAIIDRVVTTVSRGGQFKLLRVRQGDDGYRATFRITSARVAISYVDVLVARFPDGRAGVADVIWVEDGDRLSELIRHKILPAAALRDPELEARLGEGDRLFLANAKKVEDLRQASRTRKWQEVVKIYKELPAGLRDHKPLLFKYADACSHLSRADGAAALETCRRQFPGDPAADMLAAGHHFAHDEYRSASRALDALKVWSGEDALLDALQALVAAKSGRLKDARSIAERAVTTDPELKLAYLSRILVATEERNHTETLEWLKKTVENTGHDFGDLRQAPAYAEFVETPEFRQFLAWRATRPGR